MNIKELRLKLNLSQQEISDKTGIPRGRINQWERRNTIPKREDYETLERFFKLLEQNETNEKSIIHEDASPPKDSEPTLKEQMDYKDKYIALLEKQLLIQENAQNAIAQGVSEMTEKIIASSKNAAEERLRLVIQNTTILKLVQECLSTVKKKSLEEIVEMTSKIHNAVLQEAGY